LDDEEAFTLWASARRRSLLRAAFVLTGDAGQAEDLVQEAMTKVAMRWGRLRGGNPEAYARTVMHRDHISNWRRSRRLPDLERSIVLSSTGDDVEQMVVLRQALSRLTPKQRAVPVLRFYHDLSEAETAVALGVRPGTVKSQTSAALRRLRNDAPEIRALLDMEVEA
jgi:RNA polymerase sigma-70 factor (sigma-E family)